MRFETAFINFTDLLMSMPSLQPKHSEIADRQLLMLAAWNLGCRRCFLSILNAEVSTNAECSVASLKFPALSYLTYIEKITA